MLPPPISHYLTAPLFNSLPLLQSHSNSCLLVFFRLRVKQFLPLYTVATLLSTGKALLFSHVSSNINITSEIRTLKDPSGDIE